jgi:hypothetical protein
MSAALSPELPRVDWNIDIAVRIEGLPLPFRFRCVTHDHESMMTRLDEFMDAIRLKILDAAED